MSSQFIASKTDIDKRVRQMAQDILKAYRDKDPLFVCFLKGATPFASLLMFALAKADPTFHPQLDYMIVSTYKDGTQAGEPRIIADLSPDAIVKDRTVIMLDDVLDTGVTAEFVHKYLHAKGAKQIDLIVLVEKTQRRKAYPKALMAGFKSPAGKWLKGMGMDNAPLGPEIDRWLSSIEIA